MSNTNSQHGMIITSDKPTTDIAVRCPQTILSESAVNHLVVFYDIQSSYSLLSLMQYWIYKSIKLLKLVKLD
jgi:hypothetical protein